MSGLGYRRAASLEEAAGLAAVPGHELVAGGTDLLQRVEEGVQPPATLVDVAAADGLDAIVLDDAGATLGAMVKLEDAVRHPGLRDAFPAVVEALEATASVQVRNLATLGGNPLQKTRCPYFRDRSAPCNKRAPGSGCGAMTGRNRDTAILGTSEHCIAAHASDFAVAMTALDAEVATTAPEGGRTLNFGELLRTPGTEPERDHTLAPGELITGYRLRRSPLAARSHYLKVRDRAEFAWALCSAAVALELDRAGTIARARVAVGGVATKPWRLPRVEAALVDGEPSPARFSEAAARANEGAAPRRDNAFKTTLLPRTVARALDETARRSS
ncbi:MAG: FAD binding domain-containing protein [Alphaproteobacteria bacterium]